MLFNSNSSTTDVLATVDGLGRSHIMQKREGPSSSMYDSVETDYDSDGRPSRVTLPYTRNRWTNEFERPRHRHDLRLVGASNASDGQRRR